MAKPQVTDSAGADPAAYFVAAAPVVTSTPALPTRIEPVLDDKGQAVELHPPGGSRWIRDADGGLTPADADTAAAVGLAWRG